MVFASLQTDDPLRSGDPIAAAEDLIATGHAHEAARALRDRLADGRGGLLMRITLVKALIASGDVRGALAEAREASALHADAAPALVALGEALLAAESLPAAIAELQRALRLDPDDMRARHLVAEAWLRAGEADKALEILRQLDETPEHQSQVARANAIKSAARSDPGYVRHLFDQFSADYDVRMVEHLGYAAPGILRQLADLVLGGRDDLAILDLGCGTGLSGLAFRSLAARLDGIDLSPAMIEKARARNIYDALWVADLESALAAPGPFYDLLIAADTLVYLGDLSAVFQGAARRLTPGGHFLFTAEADAVSDFSLGEKRRWRHSEGYLRALTAQVGLEVSGLVAAVPRREANRPVDGFAVAIARPV